jgi:hypothetical protein
MISEWTKLQSEYRSLKFKRNKYILVNTTSIWLLNYDMNPVCDWCNFSLSLLSVLLKATALICCKNTHSCSGMWPFSFSVSKKVCYLKLWKMNDTKIYENKIYPYDKNRLEWGLGWQPESPQKIFFICWIDIIFWRSVLDPPQGAGNCQESHFFLGAFAKLRKAGISVFMSLRLSVRPHGTTLYPLEGFSLNLMCGHF